MTDEEVFDRYAAHGTTVADFGQYVGHSTVWLALQIADMDPECEDPQAAARQFMRYVADCLAGDEQEADRGKIVCRSEHGAYARHFYTDRSEAGKSVPVDVCTRCGEPRPKSTWTLADKVRCPGGNLPGTDLHHTPEGHPTTAHCAVCGKWVTVRYSRGQNAWIMRTHYVKEGA